MRRRGIGPRARYARHVHDTPAAPPHQSSISQPRSPPVAPWLLFFFLCAAPLVRAPRGPRGRTSASPAPPLEAAGTVAPRGLYREAREEH